MFIRHSQPATEEKGQGLVEYALILVLVALAVVAALTVFGSQLQAVYQCIASNVQALPPNDVGSIYGFELIDPASNDVIRQMGCLETLDAGNYSFSAVTRSEAIQSVYLELEGPVSQTRTENEIPWALFGDEPAGNFAGGNLSAGTYTLKGTPYAGNGASGKSGPTFTLIFNVE
ncbi:MAG: hypothetical protein CL607_02110 [Anaerolineaceae bacterium]|nr:hypothetical protein [Anaerolineaceae bacterium]